MLDYAQKGRTLVIVEIGCKKLNQSFHGNGGEISKIRHFEILGDLEKFKKLCTW
jgi:hypothetical protein